MNTIAPPPAKAMAPKRTYDRSQMLQIGAQLLRVEAAEWRNRNPATEPFDRDKAQHERIALALIAAAEAMEIAAGQAED